MRSPLIIDVQNAVTRNKQHPFIRDRQNPFERSRQNPHIRDTRQPSIYQVAVAQQEPNIRDRRTPFIYQTTQRNPAGGQSPFITQITYNSTRPISQVAKVKGVYVKTAQGVEKLSEIYVKKDNTGPTGTVEKIHQTSAIFLSFDT